MGLSSNHLVQQGHRLNAGYYVTQQTGGTHNLLAHRENHPLSGNFSRQPLSGGGVSDIDVRNELSITFCCETG